MTERRPHWDASLISAVLADLRDVYDSGYGEEQAFRIIAAVEDWHKAKRDSRVRTHGEHCWRWHTECAESLIEAQAATIQRVREGLAPGGELSRIIGETAGFVSMCWEPKPTGEFDAGRAGDAVESLIRELRRALDGGAE